MEATKNITQTPLFSKLCADLNKEVPMPPKSKTGSGKTQERNKDLQKTKMCVYFLQGKCGLGTTCKFAHSADEMRQAPNLQKTGLCANFMKGNCNKDNCTFAHGEEELVKPPSYKKAMCIWFRQGKCRNGASCGFVHHLSELRGELLDTEPKPPPGLVEAVPEKPLKSTSNVNDCDASTDVPSESQAETVSSDVSTAGSKSMPDEHLFRMMAGRGSAPVEQQVKSMSLAIGQLQVKLSQVQARQEAVSDRLEGETLKNQVKELQHAINKLSKQCQGTEAQLRSDVGKTPSPPVKKARPVPSSPTYRSVKAPAPAKSKPSYQFEMKAAIGVLLVAALVMVELYLPK